MQPQSLPQSHGSPVAAGLIPVGCAMEREEIPCPQQHRHSVSIVPALAFPFIDRQAHGTVAVSEIATATANKETIALGRGTVMGSHLSAVVILCGETARVKAVFLPAHQQKRPSTPPEAKLLQQKTPRWPFAADAAFC